MKKSNIAMTNLAMLKFVATKMGTLIDEVVFLGGCVVALFITDPGAPDARRTFDVDCIVEAGSFIA